MSRQLFTWLFAALLMTACSLSAQAIEPVGALPETKGPEKNPTTVELSKPVVGPVHSARASLGMEISNGTSQVGKIEDLSLDIGQGVVGGVYFRPIKPIDANQDTMVLTMNHFQWPDGDGRVTMAGLPDKSQAVSKDAKNSPAQPIMLSKSARIRILDGKGQPVGHVVDFGLARKQGQIAYAVLHLGHSDSDKDAKAAPEKAYPVPLAAFVAKEGTSDWTLDLPEKMLDGMPSFKVNETWPRVVAGTWTEFIHVRYGRSVLGGVQIEAKKFDDGGKTNPAEGPVKKLN